MAECGAGWVALFAEANALAEALGDELLASEGISLEQAEPQLAAAQQAPQALALGLIFEATAAAAYSAIGLEHSAPHLVVLDMGAGTTDIAAFEFDERNNPPALTEIKEARQCSGLAGDEIDRILIGVLANKRGAPNDQRFLRTARLAARDFKREFFSNGNATFKDGWRTIAIRAGDLTGDPQFQRYLNALGQSFITSIAAVAARARVSQVRMVDVVLAGGGANLPFLPQLVRAAAEQAAPGLAMRAGPLSPSSSLYGSVDEYFADVFPQIAISVGGSLVEMLDTRAAAA